MGGQIRRVSSTGAPLPKGGCCVTKIKRRLHGKAGFRSVLVAPESSATHRLYPRASGIAR